LETLKLDPDSAPHSLSRGERQRVALASIFVRRPKLLLLDEPTTGLDYRECMQMMQTIAQLNGETGATVLMVTHDMEIALDFARRILVLNNGQLLADGETKEIMRDEPLLAQAALIPAQLVALAARLGIPSDNAADADSMADWIEAKSKAKRSDHIKPMPGGDAQ
jgi:energy-coupling factor transport system ATP-binding protein